MKPKAFTRVRGIALVALTSIIAVLLGLIAAPAAHAATGTLRGDMFIQQGDNQLHEVTVAAGSQQNLLITYSCNGGTCLNGQIVVSLDPGATPKPAAKGPEVTSETVAGSTVTFSIPTLPQGSAGQISLPIVLPAWTIPNGTILDHSVSISSLGGQQTTTQDVRTIIGAGIEHHSSIQKIAGGAYDASTVYEVKACLDVKVPADVYGGLEIEAGSVLTASLPAGATIVNSGGGTVSGSTIEWVLPAIQSYGCLIKLVTVRYDAEDPENVLGGEKQIDVAWNGAVFDQPAGNLGGSDYTHELGGGEGNQDFVMVLTTPRREGSPEAHATYNDPVSAVFNAKNTGNVDWDSATIRSPFSTALKPTGLTASAMGGTGEIWIKKNGGAYEKALTFDGDRNINFSSLPGDWLVPFDPNTDILNEVEVRLADVVPGAVGAPLGWSGTVRNQLAGTNVDIAIDDVFTASGSLSRTAAGETVDPGGSASEDWAVDGGAVNLAVLRTESCATDWLTGIDDRDADLCFWYYNVNNTKTAKDPVAYFTAPPGVTVSDVSVHKSEQNQMPDPTVTIQNSYPGTDWTFVRLTWPAGTEMANTDAWRVDFHAKLKHAFYERHAIVGNLSLKSDLFHCAIGNYWGSNENDSGASGVDLNDNGRLNDWGCVWGHNLDPVQAIGGRVVQSIQGFWDDEFADGPAVSYSRPGREDQLRSTLENTATTFLKNAVMVTKLPRPGDKFILDSDTERNQATATFPVHLLERPVIPTLGSPVTTYWTDTVDACFSGELGSSADAPNCNPVVWTNWDTTAPADLTAVTAMKFDFGHNQLTPYGKWDVDVKVTTPTVGATEPEFAVMQSGSDPAEIAKATSAARFRSSSDVLQQPVEALAVTINMPDALGPDLGTPTAVPLTSTGPFDTEQTVTGKLPKAGEAVIYLGGSEVNGVMTGGEEVQEHTTDQGTYTLDKLTGRFTFTPVDGFVGEADAITYQVVDTRGRKTFSTYTPMVSPPGVPSPTSAVTSALVDVVQSTTVTVPSGSTIKLVNNNGTDLGANSKVIDGKGTFSLDPATGVITFTPAPGYVGAVPAIKFAITDSFGQTGYAVYTATVLAPDAPVITAITSTGVGAALQSTQSSVVIPANGRIRLVDVSGGVISSDTVTVSGKGTYSLNRDTGVISFQPTAGFSGVVPAVRWKVWDAFDQGSNVTTYTPTVTLPAAPTASAQNTEAQANRTQSVTVTPPSGGAVRLLDESNNVIDSNTVTVPDVGTYTVVPGTGVITFVPAPDYVGTPASLGYRITDAYGQTSDSTYQVDVYTAPADLTSTGVGTATQNVSATIPSSGQVRLIDGDENVVDGDEIVAEEGTYRLNRATGEISFVPALGFSGVAPGIGYQTTDAQDRIAQATYVPTVTAPSAPVALPLASNGEKDRRQSVTVDIPANTEARLVDGDNLVTRVTVPSQGTYEIDPATGVLTFTPVAGFVGSPTPVNFQLTDAYGQSSRATYEPRVDGSSVAGAQPDTAESRPGSPVTINPLSTDVAEEGHRLVASSVALKQKGKKTKTVNTPQGVWKVNPANGTVRFTASRKFVGIATVPYMVRSSSGAWFRSSMSVVVKGSVRGKASTTVYFGVRTAALTQAARKQIKSLVAKVPTIASSRVLSIGYVQPEKYRGNDQKLSKRRAVQLARAVSKSLNVSKVTITGKGRANVSSAAARRATVTVNWTATQR